MRAPAIDFAAIRSPIMLRGNPERAYRDPCGHYHDGVFRVWHTNIRGPADSSWSAATAVTESRDLIAWSKPRDVTVRDQSLNYSSPGNVIRYGGRWVMCLQTYPSSNRPGDHTARLFTLHSTDLEHWSEPELLRVKGPSVPRADMGRMIDPYLIEDQAEPGKWWCFFKQNGASRSWSRDLQHWTYAGAMEAGENVCLLAEAGTYTMFHSPANGIGIKRSPDLERWTDHGLLTLGQREWPWAQGRITAGQVLDLRAAPGVGRYVMFFHGSSPAGSALQEVHGHASLGIAWSTDLVHWQWPGGGSDD